MGQTTDIRDTFFQECEELLETLGDGLRLIEAIRLRVKDLDFAHRTIVIIEGKGGQSRRTPMPERLVKALENQVEAVRAVHARDVAMGQGEPSLSPGLATKLGSAVRSLEWQYLQIDEKRLPVLQ